jgi:hypothetical protein
MLKPEHLQNITSFGATDVKTRKKNIDNIIANISLQPITLRHWTLDVTDIDNKNWSRVTYTKTQQR